MKLILVKPSLLVDSRRLQAGNDRFQIVLVPFLDMAQSRFPSLAPKLLYLMV